MVSDQCSILKQGLVNNTAKHGLINDCIPRERIDFELCRMYSGEAKGESAVCKDIIIRAERNINRPDFVIDTKILKQTDGSSHTLTEVYTVVEHM